MLLVLTLLTGKYGKCKTARAWYHPCHPFVFLFWGYPGPQSWDDPSLPLCWEHEGEGGGGSLEPVNSQLAIPLLFSLTSIKPQKNGDDDPQSGCLEVVRYKYLQFRCIRGVWSHFFDESSTCTCPSRFNNCSSDSLYSPLLWVGSCPNLLSGALDHDVTPRSSLSHWKASGSVWIAQLNRIV